MNSRVEADTWLGRVVRVEVILLVRCQIREDAWPIALLQHVFAVVGAVDLDSWFHKVHACDAIPANDHGHHDAWIELRCFPPSHSSSASGWWFRSSTRDFRTLQLSALPPRLFSLPSLARVSQLA